MNLAPTRNSSPQPFIRNTMKRTLGAVLALLILTTSACKKVVAPPFDPKAQKIELQVEVEGSEARSVPFAELYALDALPGLSFHDPLFGEERRYVGLNLAQLRQLAGAGPEQKVLKLHCRDGYVSEVETEVLEQGQFLLAVRDVDAAPDTFVDFSQMTYLHNEPAKLEEQLKNPDLSAEERDKLKKKLDHVKTFAKDMKNLKNQGPFYPIFIPADSLPKEKRWFPPFAVDKVTFAESKTDKTVALPQDLPDDHPAMKGSKIFTSVCSSCHKVNGVGGAVGPELNRPLSVTEYWDEMALRQMMKDPSKVRDGSKMPPFHLADDKIDDVLAYLKWMSKHKLEK